MGPCGHRGHGRPPIEHEPGTCPKPCRSRENSEKKRDIPLPVPVSPPTILKPETHPIDLDTALRLAGVQNPELNVARQRVLEAAALRQLAAARFLPSINPGMNYDTHTGNLQQSNGNILSVQRSAVYVGAGSNAVAAGTVNIPGVFLGGNTAIGIFGFLESRQLVRQREFENIAVRNQVFLQVTLAYSELLRAEARHAVALQAREEARVIARLTADYAQVGQGRLADANRAATELQRREAFIKFVESEMIGASARLCQVLNLDPSIRLHPTDAFVVPHPLVPDPIPVVELIALGLLQRPELAAQRAAIARALLDARGSQGVAVHRHRSSSASARADSAAAATSSVRSSADSAAVPTSTRSASGPSRTWASATSRSSGRPTPTSGSGGSNSSRSSTGSGPRSPRPTPGPTPDTPRSRPTSRPSRRACNSFTEDLERIRFRGERDVLPIELLDSFRLMNGARLDYVDAIVDYDRAQFELYVALGQPPANTLAHPVPTQGVAPSGVTPGGPGPASRRPAAPSPGRPPPRSQARPPDLPGRGRGIHPARELRAAATRFPRASPTSRNATRSLSHVSLNGRKGRIHGRKLGIAVGWARMVRRRPGSP